MSLDSQFPLGGGPNDLQTNVDQFDLQHGMVANSDAISLVSFWQTVEAGGKTQTSAMHSFDLDVSPMGPSIMVDASSAPISDSANTAADNGLESWNTDTIHVSADHSAGLDYDISTVDHSQPFGLPSVGTADGWTNVVSNDNWQVQYSQSLDLPGYSAAPSVAPGMISGYIDARGGGGGTHPGGGGGNGGGGGGGGLLTSYTSGDPGISDANEFNIHIDFGGNWTAQEQAIVTWAADLWSKIISADVRDDTDLNGNPVDDVAISMSIGRIDGSGNPLFGNVLAQTQITAVRDPGSVDQWLPVTSSIMLDSTDLKNSINQGWSGTWDTIILHEMGHALGFAGIVFDNLGLVDSFGNFTGANAVSAYGASSVPLEQDGGSGTAGSHWDEATFAPNGVTMSNELMTGYVVQNQQTYLSDTTVGAMADLGYQVQDPSVGSSYLLIDNHLLLA